jgi:hypothetical protein
VLERDLTVVARFEPLPGEVELRVSPPEGGRIVSEPPGIECPELCAASIREGTEVELTATPDEGFALVAWTGDCEGADGPVCRLTLDRPRSAGARFEAVPGTVELTVEARGGTLTSDPRGIVCGRLCTASFPLGTRVTLTAQPAGAGEFPQVRWGGACESAQGLTCVLDLTGTTLATADISIADRR